MSESSAIAESLLAWRQHAVEATQAVAGGLEVW